MESIIEMEFILYVANQGKSTHYYQQVLGIKPSLDVPGMSEFTLGNKVKLGLMPEIGIAKILTNMVPHPNKGNGIPRCELYLKVKNPEEYIIRAIEHGGREISKLENRDWGDRVGYLSDLDGHIIAFAENGNIC